MKIANIKATEIELTPALKKYITEKINMLDKYYQDVIEVRVEVGLTSQHHNKGPIYRAELNVKVPGDLLRVEKTTENMYKSIDKVKDHMANQLKDFKEKQLDKNRGKV